MALRPRPEYKSTRSECYATPTPFRALPLVLPTASPKHTWVVAEMSENGTAANCAPTTLSRTESVGLAFFVEAGILSASSLSLLFFLIVRNILRYKKYADFKWSLVEQPADVYVLSLFVADALQSIGASMSARWIHDGVVKAGPYCTAQGVIQQLGETSVGLATMFIAIHTFVNVWMRKHHRVRTAVIIVAVSWTFMALFVGIAAGKHRNYDEPSPFWCWVGPDYKQERIFGEYFWLWLTLFVAIAVYVPLFLWNQGNISIDERSWWKVTWHWKAPAKDKFMRERPLAFSLKLLAYPVAYSIVVLPLSVVRWITFSEQSCGRSSSVPGAATFAAVFLHGCFGFVNVLLLLTTRPTLLLFDDPRNPKRLRVRRPSGGGTSVDWDVETHVGGDGNASTRKVISPVLPSPSPTRISFPDPDPERSTTTRRAASLDSSRDALGIMTVRVHRDNRATGETQRQSDAYCWSPQPPRGSDALEIAMASLQGQQQQEGIPIRLYGSQQSRTLSGELSNFGTDRGSGVKSSDISDERIEEKGEI
ncbi:hypothetical protein SCHPADRAFT_944922 [Schizopora paradoxa]|uniref:Uncharacterized protein n=1 Tax=Schizopora paradoxa TaxID=27342 RepID=A0A0H2R7P7_9AGAM|nr:hypothetical protein SCHPADRAFT_944922 [Schizopora paradoxa]